MSNFSKEYVDNDGKKSTVIVTSNDEYKIKMNKNINLANHKAQKTSKIAQKFKGTLLGADIGVKSKGFSSIAILATVIALAVIFALYFFWRF